MADSSVSITVTYFSPKLQPVYSRYFGGQHHLRKMITPDDDRRQRLDRAAKNIAMKIQIT